MEFKNLILEQLKKQGISQSTLADNAGISRQMISRWLCKGDVPTKENLLKLLKAMRGIKSKEREDLLKWSNEHVKNTSLKKRKFGTQQKIKFGLNKMNQCFNVSVDFIDIEYKCSEPESMMSFESIIKEMNRPLIVSGTCIFTLKASKGCPMPNLRWRLKVNNIHRMVNLGFNRNPIFELYKGNKWQCGDSDEYEKKSIGEVTSKLKGVSRHIFYQFLLDQVTNESLKWDAKLDDQRILPVPFDLGKDIGKCLDKCYLHISDQKKLTKKQQGKMLNDLKTIKCELYTTTFSVNAKIILLSWLNSYFKKQVTLYPLAS
jgi:transcriptional regulator with XRE-family HTH domain